jgi:hypothetical protein
MGKRYFLQNLYRQKTSYLNLKAPSKSYFFNLEDNTEITRNSEIHFLITFSCKKNYHWVKTTNRGQKRFFSPCSDLALTVAKQGLSFWTAWIHAVHTGGLGENI